MPINTNYVPSTDQIVHETSVDLGQRSIVKPIHVVQYDKSMPIVAAKLYLNGYTYTVPDNIINTGSIRVRFGKKDHTFVIKSILGTDSTKQIVYFDIDDQMTYFDGPANPIIELRYQNGNLAGSSFIPVEIDRNPVQMTDIESHVVYPEVEKIINMTVSAVGLPSGSNPTVTKTGGQGQQPYNFQFGIPKGDTGEQGEAATISVGSTTTGTPGTPAQVVNVGTSSNAIFQFTIPKGEPGSNVSYVIDTRSKITGTMNPTTQEFTNVTVIADATPSVVLTQLTLGDNILIKELEVPDYWVSSLNKTDGVTTSVNLSKLETQKVIIPNVVQVTGQSTSDIMSQKAVTDALALKEAVANKVTSIDGSSTDTQYPSAKCVHDEIVAIEEKIGSATLPDTNNATLRTTGGSLAIKDGQELVKKVEGQSYVWNQLINKANFSPTTTINGITFTNNNDGSITCNGTATADANFSLDLYGAITLKSNNKYLLIGCPSGGSTNTYYLQNAYWATKDTGNGLIFTTTSTNGAFYVSISSGTTVSNLKFYPQFFDLTQMGLGNITTVAQFKALFPNSYYPYSAPTLCSANNEYKNIGRNLWDEEWELGGYNSSTGAKKSTSGKIRSKNYINVFPSTTYYALVGNSGGLNIAQYDSNYNYIGNSYFIEIQGNGTFTTNERCNYITIFTWGTSTTTYNHDICINKSDASFNGTYEPYQENLLSYNGTLERATKEYVFTGNESFTYRGPDFANVFSIQNLITDYKYSNTIQALCNGYTFGGAIDSISYTTQDKTFYVYVSSRNEKILYIKDSAYTDANTFKASLVGKKIIYELATPTTEQIVNATNVELRGVGTAKDTLYNESGLASWKNGLTEQVNKNGIVAIPYSVSEEFAVSINGQLQHNLDVDKAQQEEIQELSDNQNKMDTIFSKQVVGGENVLFTKFNPSNNQDNHWHIVNTKVDDTLTCEDDIVVKGNIEDDHSNSISVANLVSGASVGNAMTNKHLYYHPIKITYTNGSEIIDLRFIIIDNNSNAYNKSTIGYAMAPFGFNINPLFGNYRNGTPFIYEPIANATFSATNFTFYSIKISGTDAGQLRQSIVSFTDSNLVINDGVNQLF